MKDWPTLETAIDQKLDDQEEFVKWWRDAVQRPGGDKKSGNHSPRSALMISDDAESLR